MADSNESGRRSIAEAYEELLDEITNRPMSIYPTRQEKEGVQELVKTLPMNPVARDFGYVAGKYLGDVIEMAGLRPSDYVGLEGLTESFIEVFLKQIQSNKEVREIFTQHFLEQINMRG